jgi:hypothetical protein
MKLRIFTSMLVVVFLSLFSSVKASAHDGCGGGHCGRAWHHGCWGHQGYIYGPDGYYAQHKACCAKKCESKCESKCEKKCGSSMSCGKCCGTSCSHTYRRAYYHEDCCGHSYLSCKGSSNCKSKGCGGHKSDDNDD